MTDNVTVTTNKSFNNSDAKAVSITPTTATKVKTTLLKAGVVSGLMMAAMTAHACQIPKSYYSNVFCTASSQYFLALKDSGQPVALINKAGRPVADLTRYNGIDVTKLKDGLVPVQRYGKVGYIDMSGREVIPPVYDIITNDSQTKGWARAVSNNRIVVKKGGRFGVVDTNNRVIVPFSANYQSISDYNGNLASVRRNSQTQWIDLQGRVASGPQSPTLANAGYQEPTRITSIPATRVNQTVSRSSINASPTSGSQALAIPVVSSTQQAGATTYPAVTTSNKITVLNSNSSTTSGLPSSVATPITPTHSGLASNTIPSATRITTNATIRPITPNTTATRLPIASSTSPVVAARAETITVDEKPKPSPMNREVWQPEQRDGKWGFVNRTGVPMITFSFSQVTPFSEGLAGVRMQGKWGFVNLAGELVIPFNFDESSVRRGNNTTYKGVQPFVFTGGKAWVSNMPNGAQMCINLEGNYVGC